MKRKVDDKEEHTTVRVPVTLLTETLKYAEKDALGITNQSEGFKYALRFFVNKMKKKHGEQ